MSVTVTINATNYTYPETGDENWGDQATLWAQAVSSHLLQKTGGSFILSAEVDFGATYGLASAYYKSRTANLASSGIVRLANADTIKWRNTGNSADMALGAGSANGIIAYDGVDQVGVSSTQTLTNKTLTSPVLTTPTVGGGSINTTGAGAFSAFASVGAFNLTLGGATTTISIPGNLQVDGTTVTLNTSTLDVEDTNITVNKGGNDASSEGAGLKVERTGTAGSFIYATAAASKFKLGSLGSEVEVVDLTSTQTLSAKSLATTTNTISATASHVAVYSAGNALTSEAQLAISRGGTSGATATAGFNALSPLTTKGDLISRDGTNNVRLGVGTNGFILRADSAEATGLKWTVEGTSASTLETTDASAGSGAGSVTVVSGKTRTHPFLTISSGDTFTVDASARLITIGTLTITGSLVVNGTHIAMNTD